MGTVRNLILAGGLGCCSITVTAIAPTDVIAACVDVLCDDVQVSTLVLHKDGNISVATSGDETALECEPYGPGGIYIELPANHANKKEIYATLLAAQLDNKTVRFNTIKTGVCTIDYVVIHRQE